MAITCPICDQSDRITKVSAIFSGGISSGTYQGPSVGVSTPVGKGQSSVSGGYTTLRGTSQTLLSELLAPPKKPETRGWSGCAIIGLVALGILVLMGIPGVIDGDGLYIFAEAILGLIIFLVVKSQKEKISEGQEETKEETPRWQRAMRSWDSLYYCERDDILFNPETGESFPVGAMMDYLYR